jgi:hypothetical protein
MAVSTGFNAVLATVTGGTCTTTNDQISLSGGTCTTIGYLDTYNLNSSLEVIDVTAFGDKLRKNIPGFPGYTLSMSGSYDYANAGQKSFWDEVYGTTARTSRVLQIKEQGSVTTVKGYVTGVAQGSSVGGKSTFSLIPKTV